MFTHLRVPFTSFGFLSKTGEKGGGEGGPMGTRDTKGADGGGGGVRKEGRWNDGRAEGWGGVKKIRTLVSRKPGPLADPTKGRKGKGERVGRR
jgi:hypothetical protein